MSDIISLKVDWADIPEPTRAQLAGNLAGRALRCAFPEARLEVSADGRAWAALIEGVTVVVLGHADGTFEAWAGHGLDVPEVEHPHSNSPEAALDAALRDLVGASVDASGTPLQGGVVTALWQGFDRLRPAVSDAAAAAELALLPELQPGLVWRVPRAAAGTKPRAHIVDRIGLAKCGLVPKAGWNPWPGEARVDRLCRQCSRKGLSQP